MNFRQFAQNRSFRMGALIAAATVLAGCSSGNSDTSVPSPGAKSAEPKNNSRATAAVAAEDTVEKSVFTIDEHSRDPFFPKAKRAVASAETSQAPVALDVTALLQAGFQGVIGSGETRIALVNNIMLEPGRQTVIPIFAPGQSRSVSVRCLEVLKDAVVLEVQGHAQPIRLIRAAYN